MTYELPEPWQTRAPDLVADVRLYATAEGGRRTAAVKGYGCPCVFEAESSMYDARLQLGDEPFLPGTERRVGFVFLTPEGAAMMRRAGRFYLWEGRFVGEAIVVAI